MTHHSTSSSEESTGDQPVADTHFSGHPGSDREKHIPLTGWFERNNYSPGLVGILTLIVTFILFQGIGTVVGGILLLMRGGLPADTGEQELVSFILSEYPDIVLVGNSIGQVLGLALPVLFLVRLHTPSASRYLNIQRPDMRLFVAGLIGWVVILPVVQWLGHVNEFLPLPEGVRQFDREQMQLIEKVFASDLGLALNLLTLAVVPAFCEELLFRGYLQRNFERATGVIGGIVVTGLIFGVYHLRLTQVLPLCLLGLYLGYVLWVTRSLWTAIAVHFANNALAVVVGVYLKEHPDLPAATMEELTVPWYSVVFGMLVTSYIMYWMYRRKRHLAGRR